MKSGAPEVAEEFLTNKNLTCDVGAVLFGDAVTITADGPWQYLLHELTGRKWGNLDVEERDRLRSSCRMSTAITVS
jgi:formylmethanofuran dehydrogenase subunit A